jgi:hypothetical protein
MLSYIIDVKEGRTVATAGIPGALMQMDMFGIVHMVLEGTMAELLVKIDPKLYRKYLLIKEGKPVMYVQLEKALYGTLQAGLLFWEALTKNLKKWSFKIGAVPRKEPMASSAPPYVLEINSLSYSAPVPRRDVGYP